MNFRLITHTATALMLAAALAACNGDKEKLADKEKELNELRQLAELDKREMENQYAEFASQYSELKKTVRDDSLVARLDAEQARAEALLKELKSVKASSSAEILRLKKELATVRAVLRDYVRQVDSLQRINQALIGERDMARAEAERTRSENASIHEQNTALSEKVAIASQLDATGISIAPLKKNGKNAKRSKDIRQFTISFTITRNVTAATGNRTIYVRLLKPTRQVVGQTGTFTYENKSLGYSAAKTIEYNGQETRLTVYIPVSEYLGAGNYTAHIFADGQMIGSSSINMEK